MKHSKALTVAALLTVVLVGLASLPPPTASAQTAPLRVLSANAVKAVLQTMQPQCERAIGRPLQIQFETSAGLKRAIEAGAAYDVIIVNAESMDALIKEAKIAPGSRSAIARTIIGVGVRAGAPLPDIATPAAMKRALLAAKKVAYPREGSSTPYILKMFDRLGIAEQLKPNTLPEVSTNDAIAHVVDGSAEFLVSLVSEILPAKGIQYAGPVPAEFQGDLFFSAGIGAKAENIGAAQALLKFLTSPAVVPALKSMGMEPVKHLKK